MVSRIGIALTHAVFWSITASLAVRLAPAGKTNQALGLLSTGTVLAMVLGIPLGRVVGQYFGWQLSFLLIGGCAAGVMLVLAKNLPALPSQNTGSLSSLPSLFKRRNLMLLYAMTVLIITAHFTAYSYIEPFVLQVGGFKAEQVTIVLSLYGLAGFAASYLFGKWFAKSQRLFMLGAVAVILLSALLLLPFASFPYAVYALVFYLGRGHRHRQLGHGIEGLGICLGCNRCGQLDLFRFVQCRHRRRCAFGTLCNRLVRPFQYRHCRSLAGGGRFGRLRLVV